MFSEVILLTIRDDMLEKAILLELSARVRDYRISKSITRKELADRAMLSEGTLKRFENGQQISLENFIKILRVLGLSQNFDLLIPDQSERPSFHAQDHPKRKRARRPASSETEWKWGDEI